MIVIPAKTGPDDAEGIAQGTPEWLQLRCGIPTASRFDRLLTPQTMKLSKSAESFAVELATERILGIPIETGKSDWMQRGNDMEEEARKWFAFNRDVVPEQVAFCYTDDHQAGCSPDSLIGEDEGLEIKCPSAHVHIGHLLGRTDPAEKTQVQGSLLVTGRKAWNVVSYCRGLPPVLIRYQRDEKFIAALDLALTAFIVGVDGAVKRIQEMGFLGRIEGFGEDPDDGLVNALYDSVHGEEEA